MVCVVTVTYDYDKQQAGIKVLYNCRPSISAGLHNCVCVCDLFRSKMSRSKDLRTVEINHRWTYPVHLVLVNESIFTNEKCGKPIHPPVTTYIHHFHDHFQMSHGFQPVAPLTLLFYLF